MEDNNEIWTSVFFALYSEKWANTTLHTQPAVLTPHVKISQVTLPSNNEITNILW